MTVRLRRLYADYQRLIKFLANYSFISIEQVFNEPPDRYHLIYYIDGLVSDDAGIKKISEHRVEVMLPIGYPKESPICKMRSKIFHPNISPQTICIADYWVAGESLIQLVLRIGEMISYQSFNIKSPLDGEAAKWTEMNSHLLPIDRRNLQPFMNEGDILLDALPEDKAVEVTKCENCHQTLLYEKDAKCSCGRSVCSDCSDFCISCKSKVCVCCGLQKCAICNSITCIKCSKNCKTCGKLICQHHSVVCAQCFSISCSNCAKECDYCRQPFCYQHYNMTRSSCNTCTPHNLQAGNDISSVRQNIFPPNSNICPGCGESLEDYARFCTRCGKRVK